MTDIDLERLRPLVEIMAAERTDDEPELFEDCVQEGLIAAWLATQTHPGMRPAYYHSAARRGVLSVLRGRPSTGAEGRRGWQDAHDHTVPLVVERNGVEYYATEPIDDDTVRALEVIENRDDAVSYAVNSLPSRDREDVLTKFWGEKTWGDVADETGRTKRSVEHRWSSHTRPALRDALAVYADAY